MIVSLEHPPCTICDFSFNDCDPLINKDGFKYCTHCYIGTVHFPWTQVKECNPLSCIRKECNHA